MSKINKKGKHSATKVTLSIGISMFLGVVLGTVFDNISLGIALSPFLAIILILVFGARSGESDAVR